jgi:hypothetical protein
MSFFGNNASCIGNAPVPRKRRGSAHIMLDIKWRNGAKLQFEMINDILKYPVARALREAFNGRLLLSVRTGAVT